MGIKTTALTSEYITDFISTFETEKYYTFGSSLENLSVSGDTQASTALLLGKTIFGKRIQSADVKPMIRKVVWQTNTVYDQYDDRADLSSLNYYVICEPDLGLGDSHVFKCISNNGGVPSIDKPIYSGTIGLQHYVVSTADGYKWKYMYKVTSDQVLAYGTSTLFPIIPDVDVEADSTLGIDNIVIDNIDTNSGYTQLSGSISSVNNADSNGGRTIHIQSAGEFNQIDGYYTGATFYATSSSGVISRKYIIRSSGVVDGSTIVSVAGYSNGDIVVDLLTSWTFIIVPTIEIIGTGTGASALATVQNGHITNVAVLSPGTGYTRAVARVVPPNMEFDPSSSLSGDVTCLVRAILPPSTNGCSGHGSNPVAELCSRHVLLAASFGHTGGDEIIPDSNTYSKIAVVKNPEFTSNTDVFDNRIRVEVDSVDQVLVGDKVTQSSTGFYGTVHSIDVINNYMYLVEYMGPYIDTTYTDAFFVSGASLIDSDESLVLPSGLVDVVDGSVVYPPYIQQTGNVIYVEDFDSFERSVGVSEQFKFIVEF